MAENSFHGNNTGLAGTNNNYNNGNNMNNTSGAHIVNNPLNSPSNDNGHVATADKGTLAATIPNSEAFYKLHHYIYPPAKTNKPETEKLYHQMALQLSRVRGDETTPLIVPQAAEDVVNKRRDKHGFFSLRLTSIFDTSSDINHRGVFFDPIIRTVGPCSEVLIGRYTERLNDNLKELPEYFKPALFKSKVVSRTHGCFKVDIYGNWYIQDLKSSSGTFLNHQRIAPASTLSNDFLLKDGDVIQLGMDFRGGQEELYRCIKFRVELNNSWKLKPTQFNKEVLEKLKKNLFNSDESQQEDCSICLTKLKPCQPIFLSPCAHSWHYSCIRRILTQSYPQFDCPNCRKRTDLEASLDSESEFESEDEDDHVHHLNNTNSHSKNPHQLTGKGQSLNISTEKQDNITSNDLSNSRNTLNLQQRNPDNDIINVNAGNNTHTRNLSISSDENLMQVDEDINHQH